MARTLFSDKVVTPSELNRHSGRILHEAAHTPVTVRMKDEDVVILRRDLAANLFQEDVNLRNLQLLDAYVVARLSLSRNPKGSEFDWLDVFDNEDLVAFSMEYGAALAAALAGRASWDEVEDVLHEWKESAFALRDKELQEAAQSLAAGSERASATSGRS